MSSTGPSLTMDSGASTRRKTQNIFGERYSLRQVHYYVTHPITGERIITNDSQDYQTDPPSHSSHPTTSPSTFPSSVPTLSLVPSTSPSLAPTTSHVPTLSIEPSISPSTMPSLSTKPSSSPTQSPSSVPTEEEEVTAVLSPVPFTSYDLSIMLEFTRRSLIEKWWRFLELDKGTMDALANELDVVMTDYMAQELQDELGVYDNEFVGVYLTVTPNEGNSTRRLLRGGSPDLSYPRYLREGIETATFEVTGSGIFSLYGEEDIGLKDLSLDLDTAVESLFHESNDDDLVHFMQTHPQSNLLKNVVAVNEEAIGNNAPIVDNNKETKNDNGSKPRAIAITFGLLLVAFAVLSLTGYLWVFWKKRKDRQKKGLENASTEEHNSNDSPEFSPPSTITTPGMVRVSPDNASPRNDFGLSPARSGGDVEESWSGEEDDIGNELDKAVSYDRKAWESRQDSKVDSKHQMHSLAPQKEGTVQQAATQREYRTTLYDVKGCEQDGGGIMMDTSHEERATMFARAKSDDSCVVRNSGTSFYMGGHKDFSSLSLPDKKDESCSSDWSGCYISDVGSEEFTNAKFSSSPLEESRYKRRKGDLALYFAQEGNSESEEIPFRRTQDQSSSQESSLVTGDVSTTDESAGRHLTRAKPLWDTSLWDTSSKNSVATYDRKMSMSRTDTKRTLDRISNDLESLLTAEIVREVQLLSRFVKKYEKTNDKKKDARKDHSIFSHGSSSGYDSLGEPEGPVGRLQSKTGQRLQSRDTRHQSTQTLVKVADSDESSVSITSSDFDGESVPTDVSIDSRLGIDPRKVQKFSAGCLIGHQVEQDDILKDLQRHNAKKEETLISLRQGESLLEEHTPTKTGRDGDVPTGAESDVTPRQDNTTNFRKLMSVLEANIAEEPASSSSSSENDYRIGIMDRDSGTA